MTSVSEESLVTSELSGKTMLIDHMFEWMKHREEDWAKKEKQVEAKLGEHLKKLKDDSSEKDDIIANLREDLAKIKSEIEEVKENTVQKSEFETLRSQLATKTLEYNDLEKKSNSKKVEFNTSGEHLASKAIVDKLTAELEKLKSDQNLAFKASTSTITDIGAQLLSKEKELDNITLELTTKIDEVNSLRKKLEVSEDKYNNEFKAHSRLKLHIRSEIKPMLRKISEETDQLNKVNVEVRRQNESLQSEIASLKSDLAKLEDKYSELLDAKSTNEFHLKVAKELKAKIKVATEMQNTLNVRTKAETELKYKLSDMKDKYDALQAERFIHKQAIKHFRTERRKFLRSPSKLKAVKTEKMQT